MEPQQSLSTAELLGVMGVTQQVQQPTTFPGTELESRHASPPSSEGVAKPVPGMKKLSPTYLVTDGKAKETYTDGVLPKNGSMCYESL